jgi:RNA polymerase sigma factor (sigma-70 family)
MAAMTGLVAAAAAGDEEAWTELVDRYTNLLWSIARGHRLGTADAGDVVQTVWLRLVEHLDRIREPERVGAWLATTARNESLRLLRRSSREVPSDDELELDLTDDPQQGSPEAAVLGWEADALLWAAVEQLPDRCRRLIRLLMADPPPSYEDVSAALDMPVGSIGPNRGRCLERLRRTATAAGIAVDAN